MSHCQCQCHCHICLLRPTFFGEAISYESVIGRWRQTVQMFGHIFCEDVGSEPGSIINELGGFPVKEIKFRRDMEKLRNSQQKDLTIEVVNLLYMHYLNQHLWPLHMLHGFMVLDSNSLSK